MAQKECLLLKLGYELSLKSKNCSFIKHLLEIISGDRKRPLEQTAKNRSSERYYQHATHGSTRTRSQCSPGRFQALLKQRPAGTSARSLGRDRQPCSNSRLSRRAAC